MRLAACKKDRIQMLRALLSRFAVPVSDPDLAHAQLVALATQIPMLYGILTVNTVALVITHIRIAPIWLTVLIPTALSSMCLARLGYWLRQRNAQFTKEEASRRLRATIPLVGVLGVCFMAWSLSLYPYGDAYAKCHVAFYMSITDICCIFCLMHLLAAALLLSAIVILPFCIFFFLTGQPVLIAIAVNFSLVAAAMIFIMLRNYRDFATLNISRRELQARQAETERLSTENFKLANLDSLTGLPNRRRYLADLDHALAEARRDGTRLAVALIDLDGFKDVNDAYGHITGDRLLFEVGERLLSVASPTVCVARLGGDEFGAILVGDPTDPDIESFGQDLCNRLRGHYLEPGTAAEVSGSMGLVAYPEGGQTAQVLFERADYALYHAKQTCRGMPVIFSHEHETMIRDSARLDLALRHADLDREMYLVFQPIVDGTTGEPVAFEVLARWDSPELGKVRPDLFIRAAERNGMINQLTEILFAKALATLRTWPEWLRIAFNLSAMDLTSAPTIATIIRLVGETGVMADRIDLEITETAIMRDFDESLAALATLRQFGLRFSLDDFGTGFSSLSHVHRLKLDKLKIDKSFVDAVVEDASANKVVRTIVDLCRNLEIGCIVEGVETEVQRNRLLSLGGRFMQGYLFSRPLPETAIGDYLAKHARLRQSA
jgi:diguanylate cyclase (GGDEF)-like protein